MNIPPGLKHNLKIIRWQGRRTMTALRWGNDALQHAPIIFGNAIPKAGSHLIIQVLLGLVELGPFVNPGMPPVNRTEDNRKLPEPDILRNIKQMRSGDIAYGYIKAVEPFVSALTTPRHATIFVYRDPRDLVISEVFYATQLHKRHALHRYFNEELHTMEERILAVINGIPDPQAHLNDIRMKYDAYVGWLEHPEVLCLRFEDLILDRDKTLDRILEYLATRGFSHQVSREKAVDILREAINPQKSGTYRKAQPGNWQQHFTKANKAALKELAGDILIQLGYENDYAW